MAVIVPAGEGGMSQEEKAKMVLDDLGDRLPDQFDMEDIRSRVDEVTPYAMVAIQVGVCMCVSASVWQYHGSAGSLLSQTSSVDCPD
jgi:hypothetical protein